ncbi:MAG: hypothetical protein P8104_01095 [Gammaproteobacteria bacterium]
MVKSKFKSTVSPSVAFALCVSIINAPFSEILRTISEAGLPLMALLTSLRNVMRGNWRWV